jgi:hypothetical protein
MAFPQEGLGVTLPHCRIVSGWGSGRESER